MTNEFLEFIRNVKDELSFVKFRIKIEAYESKYYFK